MRLAVAAAAMSYVLAGVAIAQETPIFEIPFGQQLTKPFAKCDDAGRDRMDWCQQFPTSGRTLFLSRPPRDTERKIPSWITDGIATVKMDDGGKVVQIFVTTVGPGRQVPVIESVTARFGDPVKLDRREAKNAYGASWMVSKVEWSTSNVHISYDCTRRDECFLIFRTPEELDRQMKEAAARKSKDKM